MTERILARRSRGWIGSALCLLGCAAVQAQPAQPPSDILQNATTAYSQNRVAVALDLFRTVANDAARPAADRASAGRGLARIHWLVFRDADAALGDLRSALATGATLCPTTIYYLRVLQESGRARLAVTEQSRLSANCISPAGRDQLLLEAAKASLALAAAARGSARNSALANAGASVRALSDLQLRSPRAARVRLLLAVETSRPDDALEAWRRFYWLTDSANPSAFPDTSRDVEEAFRGALTPHPTTAGCVRLLALLVRGGFDEEARRLIALRNLASRARADPHYPSLAGYLDFRARVDALTLRFDQQVARTGTGDGAAYASQVNQLLADAARRIDRQAATPSAIAHTLYAAYGLYYVLGETSNVMSFHAGHAVQDETRHIDQFGRSSSQRFLSLDNMVSNGFNSWLSDGSNATGGWQDDEGAIIQVRSAYVGGMLGELAAVSAEPRPEQPQADDRSADVRLLGNDNVAFLPGLGSRLARQAREQVAEMARDVAERSGTRFEDEFVRLFWSIKIDGSIFIHEGRHALDTEAFTGRCALGLAELEYRAKLSELQLGTVPRMAFSTINADNVGTSTPHGEANTRILQGFVRWIVAHSREVRGFDAAQPAMVQIDRLTDEQIRAVAADLDPHFSDLRPTCQ